MSKKIINWSVLVIFTFVSVFLPFPAPISKAQAQGNSSLRGITTTATSGFSFKKDLMMGDTDPDVKELQKVLNSSSDTAVALTGSGSAGQESTYFGSLTKNAVIKFQEKNRNSILVPAGLTSGNGIVGKLTRTQLNLLIGVTVTTDSVGLPQNRAGSANTSSPSASVSNAETCNFVELLISIQVIEPINANPARAALNCSSGVVVVTPPPPPPPVSNADTCNFVELLISIQVIEPINANPARAALNCPSVNNNPSVDLKVNNSDGPVTVPVGSTYKLSWKSHNTVSCSDGKSDIPTTAHSYFIAKTSLTYSVACIGVNGASVVDTVTVRVSDPSVAQATSSIVVLSSKITPGYDYANVEVVTNIPTKLIMTYTNTPTATSSVKLFESATSTNHNSKLLGLTPNSTYYLIMGIVGQDGSALMSNEFVFTTLSSPSLNPKDSSLKQRVLYSPGGLGVVSIPESESLKTKNKVTLEAWVKPTSWSTSLGMSNTNDSVIISKGNVGGNIDYSFSLENGRLVYSNNDASLWTCGSVVPLNQWTHVAVSVDESSQNISLYVNGNKQNSICEGPRGVFSKAPKINKSNAITEAVSTAGTATSSVSSSANTSSGGWGNTSGSTSGVSGWGGSSSPAPTSTFSSSPLSSIVRSNVYLGNYYPNNCGTDFAGNGFIGLIDNVKIWNIARTATQIKDGMATSTATSTSAMTATTTSLYYSYSLPAYIQSPTGLVGHWSFDDGSVTDLSLKLNNGDLKGDMEIVDDETAKSEINAPLYSAAALNYSFPESCDSAIEPPVDEPSGYEIAFKGGVKSVNQSGDSHLVTLETCDDPREDLVKKVSVIGQAPPKDASYYNSLGTISVSIATWLGTKLPSERDTIQGTAVNYISTPGGTTPSQGGSSADYIGTAGTWTPVAKSCMKPEDKILGLDKGTFTIVAVVVTAVVIAVVCSGCYLAMASYLPGGAPAGVIGGTSAFGVPVTTSTAAAVSAGSLVAAPIAGSQIKCDEGDTGCY